MGNSDLLEELERLRKENEQLKNLLTQYHISIPTRNISCPHASVVQNITIESKDKQHHCSLSLPKKRLPFIKTFFVDVMMFLLAVGTAQLLKKAAINRLAYMSGNHSSVTRRNTNVQTAQINN